MIGEAGPHGEAGPVGGALTGEGGAGGKCGGLAEVGRGLLEEGVLFLREAGPEGGGGDQVNLLTLLRDLMHVACRVKSHVQLTACMLLLLTRVFCNF